VPQDGFHHLDDEVQLAPLVDRRDQVSFLGRDGPEAFDVWKIAQA
jgi:hypothetical protein